MEKQKEMVHVHPAGRLIFIHLPLQHPINKLQRPVSSILSPGLVDMPEIHNIQANNIIAEPIVPLHQFLADFKKPGPVQSSSQRIP